MFHSVPLKLCLPLLMHKCTVIMITLPLSPSVSPHRKNPIHFQEYSHDFSSSTPDGADSGDDSGDDKPMCPYGTTCYRCIHVHYDKTTHTKKQANKQAKNNLHDMYSMQYMYYALVCLLEYEYQFFFVDCITHGLLP